MAPPPHPQAPVPAGAAPGAGADPEPALARLAGAAVPARAPAALGGLAPGGRRLLQPGLQAAGARGAGRRGWRQVRAGGGSRAGGHGEAACPPPRRTPLLPGLSLPVSAQGLPGGRAGSGPVRGAAGGDQGGGGAGLLAAGRLTPGGGEHGCPPRAAPATASASRASAGGPGQDTSWTQWRPRPLPCIPAPPGAAAASINLVICSRPGPCLTRDPSPSVTPVYQRPKRVRLPPGTYSPLRASVSSWGWGGDPLGESNANPCPLHPRGYGEMSPTEKARVDFSAPSLSSNWQSWPQKTSLTSSRNLRVWLSC